MIESTLLPLQFHGVLPNGSTHFTGSYSLALQHILYIFSIVVERHIVALHGLQTISLTLPVRIVLYCSTDKIGSTMYVEPLGETI